MTTWAPNSPDVLGSEWMPTEQGFRALNGDNKAAAMKIRSTVTEDINRVVLGVLPSSVLRPEASDWWVEIFREGDEIPGPVTTTTYYPNAADAATTNWANQAGTTVPAGAGTIATDIGQAAVNISTYVQYRGTYQAKGPLRIEFNSAAFPAGRRVVGGRVVITAGRLEASGQLQVAYRDPLNGVAWVLATITVDQEPRTFEIPWPEANPVTGEPWTQSDIALLDSTASIRLKPLGIGKNKPLRVYEMRLELDHVEENRDGGFLIQRGSSPYAFPIRPFDGFDLQPGYPLVYGSPWSGGGVFTPWSKVADVTYTFLARRVPRHAPATTADQDLVPMVGGQIGWQYLQESPALAQALGRTPSLPDGYMASYEPTLNSDGTVATMGDAGVRGYALGFTDSSDDYSIDGQPYLRLSAFALKEGGFEVLQEFTTPAASTGTYGVLRLLGFEGGPHPDPNLAGNVNDAEMTAEIRRISNGALMGSASTGSWTDAPTVGKVGPNWENVGELQPGYRSLQPYDPLPLAPVKLLEMDIGSAGLANATEYAIVVGTDGESPEYLWVVGMEALGSSGSWGDEGFAGIGGLTDGLIGLLGETYLENTATGLPTYSWQSGDYADNDPTAGKIKGNSDTPTSITRINVDDIDGTGTSQTAVFTSAAAGDYIAVKNVGGGIGYGIFRITGVTRPGTYSRYTVQHIHSGVAGVDVNFNGLQAVGIYPIPGYDDFATRDLIFHLIDPPAAPTDFATTIATQTLATPVDGSPEFVTSLEYVSVTWTTTALGARFSHYEIQRSGDGDTTWESIARITDEAVEEFRDYEGWRNVEATYRMRAWTTYATYSDWTATSAETPEMTECALLFTSNEDPDLNLGFVDVGGERRYAFQSADEREFHTLVGRSYQVVTSPLEYRGDAFEVTLAVQAGATHTSVGRSVFDAAEALSNAAVSYVCVLDETGRRWFADVAVSEGRRRGNTHEASARIIELTDMPSLVDVTFQ